MAVVYIAFIPNVEFLPRFYVGQTVQNITRRMGDHFRKARRGIKHPFYAAIRKHGFAAFTWISINVSAEEMNKTEAALISQLGTIRRERGYNLSLGGEPNHLGWKHSDAAKAKIGAAQKGNQHCLGHPTSLHQKRTLSLMMRGKRYRLGQKASAQTKEKMSSAMSQFYLLPGTKEAQSRRMKLWWAERKLQSLSA